MEAFPMFEDERDFAIAVSIVHICHPNLWAVLLERGLIEAPSGKVISKKPNNTEKNKIKQENAALEFLKEWANKTGLQYPDNAFEHINVQSNLHDKIQCLFDCILPFVVENNHLLKIPYFKKNSNEPSVLINNFWLRESKLKYDPLFHLIITHFIVSDFAYAHTFLTYMFTFKAKESSWYNVGVLYDAIPINVGVLLFLEIEGVETQEHVAYIDLLFQIISTFLVYWIELGLQNSKYKKNSPRFFFYQSYIDTFHLTKSKLWKETTSNVAVEDLKIFIKVCISHVYTILHGICKEDSRFKRHMLMVQTCIIIVDDPDLNYLDQFLMEEQ